MPANIPTLTYLTARITTLSEQIDWKQAELDRLREELQSHELVIKLIEENENRNGGDTQQ